MKRFYFLLSFLMLGNFAFSSTIIVTSKNDTGTGSLRAAIDSASSTDTIRFAPNLLQSGTDSIVLTSEIAWTNKALTIVGLYNSTDTLYISGGNTTRIFNANLSGAPAGQKYIALDSVALVRGKASGNGGAVNVREADSLLIDHSTFYNNSATSYGGGVYSTSRASSVTVTNSTFYNNTAGYAGGGVYSYSNYGSSSIVTVTNSTFYKNTATKGGGVYSYYPYSSSPSSPSSPSPVEVSGSILWNENNIYSSSGNIISNGYNIFKDAPSTRLGVSAGITNIDSASLNLQPLAYNGGTTKTLLPGAGSVAINAGRVSDYSDAQNRPIEGTRDIGAAERYCVVTVTDTQTACDSLTWMDGITYNASNNTATYTIPSTVVGVCDSVFTLNLTINNSNTGDTTAVACDSFTWYGTTYNSSGTPTHTLTNAAGCDSVVTLNLTINNSNTGDTTAVACDSFTWYGTTYTSSGTPTHTLTNVAGCDSVVTLNLTINSSNTGDTTAVACDSFTWYGTTYTSSGTPTHTFTNVAGCDSLVTLNLTINNSNTGTDTQTACDSYTWIDGNTYTSSNNTATHTLTNAAGCDSVVTLNLTIRSVSNTNVTVNDPTLTADIPFVPGVSLQWLRCPNYTPVLNTISTSPSFTPTMNGEYAVRIVENGCVDTSACYLVSTVDVKNIEAFETINVYPNPATDYITVDFGKQTSTKVELLNSLGQLVSTYRVNNQSSLNISTVDFSRGVYFVNIQEENRKLIKRIVLTK